MKALLITSLLFAISCTEDGYSAPNCYTIEQKCCGDSPQHCLYGFSDRGIRQTACFGNAEAALSFAIHAHYKICGSQSWDSILSATTDAGTPVWR